MSPYWPCTSIRLNLIRFQISRFVISQQAGGKATLKVEDPRETLGAQAVLDTDAIRRQLQDLEEHADNVKRALGSDYLAIQRLKSDVPKLVNNMVSQRKPITSLGEERDIRLERAVADISATMAQTVRDSLRELRAQMEHSMLLYPGDVKNHNERLQTERSSTHEERRQTPPRSLGIPPALGITPDFGVVGESSLIPVVHSRGSSVYASAYGGEVEEPPEQRRPWVPVASNTDVKPFLGDLSDTSPSPVMFTSAPSPLGELQRKPTPMGRGSTEQSSALAGAETQNAHSTLRDHLFTVAPTTGNSLRVASAPPAGVPNLSGYGGEASVSRRTPSRRGSTPVADNPEEPTGPSVLGMLRKSFKPIIPKPIKRPSGDSKSSSSSKPSSPSISISTFSDIATTAENTPRMTTPRSLSATSITARPGP